jgi:hypothetical protein
LSEHVFFDLASPAEALIDAINGLRFFAQAGNRYPLFGIMPSEIEAALAYAHRPRAILA